MAKSVTVNFEDGTSHTYDNVPDDVTDDQVQARASGEFGDKTVTGVSGGAAPQAAPVAPEASVGEKIVGGAQTAFKTLQPVAEFAMQHPIETAVAGSYIPGVNKLPGFKDVAAARGALYDKYIGQQQTLNALKTPAPAPATPPVGGAAAAESQTFLQRMAQQLGQVRQAVQPVVERAGAQAVNAGRAVAPYAARGTAALTLGLMPGNVGQNYPIPQAGPHRGMEINPATNRPWTPQELENEKRLYVH